MTTNVEGGDEKGPVGFLHEPSAQRHLMFKHTSAAQVHLTAPPASGTFNFLERKQNQPLREFVPESCRSGRSGRSGETKES